MSRRKSDPRHPTNYRGQTQAHVERVRNPMHFPARLHGAGQDSRLN
jgi:hypothetical protein